MSASMIMDDMASQRHGKTRYFSATGCVIEYTNGRDVFIHGSLIGTFEPKERDVRNMLIVVAARSEGVVLEKLASAFGVTSETVRKVRLHFEQGGVQAIAQDRRGRKRKLTDKLQARLNKLFDNGLTIDEVHQKIGKQVSRAVVGRAHKRWVEDKQAAAKQKEQEESEQLSLDDMIATKTCARSSKSTENGSSMARAASSKVTPCFAAFAAALLSSHSKSP